MHSKKGVSSTVITSGWIFSPFEDALVFVGPVVLAAILLGIYSGLGYSLVFPETPMWALAVFFICIDIPHVYTTLFRTYLEPQMWRKRSRLLVFSPVLCFGAGTGLYLYSGEVFWHAVSYFAVFHFLRQIYGWVMWSAAKGGENNRWDRTLNQITAYAITVFPLIWLFSHDTGAMWYAENDFPQLFPAAVGDFFHCVYFAILILFVGRQIFHWSVGHGFNLAKNMIILVSAVIWYVPMVLLVDRKLFIVGLALQTLSHGIPYIFLTYKYGYARWSETKGFRSKLFKPLGMGLCFLCFIGIAVLESLGERAEETALFLPWQKALILGLVTTPQLVHYLLDGFIWKTSRDPLLRQTLDKMQLS